MWAGAAAPSPGFLGSLWIWAHIPDARSLCQGQSAGHKALSQDGRKEETTAHTFPGGSPGHPLLSRVTLESCFYTQYQLPDTLLDTCAGPSPTATSVFCLHGSHPSFLYTAGKLLSPHECLPIPVLSVMGA